MRIKPVFLIGVCAVALAGCGGVKKQLGLERNAPDEFTVVKRAPLELPPDYALRPPRPGAPRPQEKATVDQAETTVFGGKQGSADVKPGTGEESLLREAGADNARPDIRQVVDRETAATAPARQTAVKKLLNIGSTQPPAANVVNAPAEAARIKGNQASGKPVTAGDTPSREE